jgi:hypothetical protein
MCPELRRCTLQGPRSKTGRPGEPRTDLAVSGGPGESGAAVQADLDAFARALGTRLERTLSRRLWPCGCRRGYSNQ